MPLSSRICAPTCAVSLLVGVVSYGFMIGEFFGSVLIWFFEQDNAE